MGLSFESRKIIASGLWTGHPIHNRTIDVKYTTAVERPTTPDTHGSRDVLHGSENVEPFVKLIEKYSKISRRLEERRWNRRTRGRVTYRSRLRLHHRELGNYCDPEVRLEEIWSY